MKHTRETVQAKFPLPHPFFFPRLEIQPQKQETDTEHTNAHLHLQTL